MINIQKNKLFFKFLILKDILFFNEKKKIIFLIF